MTIIIQAVEAGGRSGGRNFSAIEFAGKKSPDLAVSNVDRYVVEQLYSQPSNKMAANMLATK